MKACSGAGGQPIDGIVLVSCARCAIKPVGINVPFPEDSQSIIDTITRS
jgi:hypothetical protein